ncbi:MAG TPA: 2-amino-4-hydroxy-6-hydroxymethyldihydropteridine diphosphokinase [Micropepsaceae bacterium]|nr:2-amino-4-hydroxy-6-hydroxymethyldihydropteridine diphosphokinase [Micropepsaceae bacterium]
MILIALGANLPSPAGKPADTLNAALAAFAVSSITIEKQSGFYLSAAWPNPHDPPFINAVAAVRTDLSPAALLAVLHGVEASFGRKRAELNAPRTLDLDILDYDGRVEQGPPILPHPRMEGRAFVLLPLRDVAPDWRHPSSGHSISELISALPPTDITRLP